MAHPHSHHHHLQTSSCCCCSCPSPPPPPAPLDPLLQALLSQQLLQNPQVTHLYSQFTTPNPAAAAAAATPFSSYPHHHPKQKHSSRNQENDQSFQTNSILLSLLERISILEASLHRLSSPSHPPFSLRDVAARTIQTHFRAYLVRRSRTLRNLKELASIKSSLNTLKSSLSRQVRLDFESLSGKATDLLLKVDAIQGGDQMIRDSKRSITQEIVRFLDLVDGACVSRKMKNSQLGRRDYGNGARRSSVGSRGNVSFKHHGLDTNHENMMEDLVEIGERVHRYARVSKEDADVDDGEHNANHKNRILIKQGVRSNVEKRVCFVEDENLARVYTIDELVAKGDEEGKEMESDGEESSQASDGGRSLVSGDEIGEDHQDRNDKIVFSAPMPVKMESRSDVMNKKQGVKMAR